MCISHTHCELSLWMISLFEITPPLFVNMKSEHIFPLQGEKKGIRKSVLIRKIICRKSIVILIHMSCMIILGLAYCGYTEVAK